MPMKIDTRMLRRVGNLRTDLEHAGNVAAIYLTKHDREEIKQLCKLLSTLLAGPFNEKPLTAADPDERGTLDLELDLDGHDAAGGR